MREFKCPATEQGMVTCGDGNGQELAHITCKITEPTKHILYITVDGAWKKIKTSDDPYELYDIVWGGK